MLLIFINFILFFTLGLIVFYTEKIHSLGRSDYDPLRQILKKYPDLFQSFKKTKVDPKVFLVPGLLKAQTLEKETNILDDCNEMTPQGLAITEDYLFISAYCSSHEHLSVIFMIDKKEESYVKTIILKDRTHAGGLVYDGSQQCLWVSAAAKEHGRVAAIAMEDIFNYQIVTTKTKPIKYAKSIDFPSIYQASYITMVEDSLLAGTFNKNKNGVIEKADLIEDEGITSFIVGSKKVTVPKKTQGLVFYKNYCLLSQSFGPVNSKIYVFSNDQFYAGTLNKKNALKVIKAPPYLEQLAVFGDCLYTLFESGAANYREKTAKFLMEVVAFHLPTLLELEEDS